MPTIVNDMPWRPISVRTSRACGPSADYEGKGRLRLLELRHVKRDSPGSIEPVLLHVARHADNRAPRPLSSRIRIIKANSFADGILVRPKLLRHRFAYEDGERRVGGILRVQRATAHDRDRHGPKVIRRHKIIINVGQFAWCPRLSFDLDCAPVEIIPCRQNTR